MKRKSARSHQNYQPMKVPARNRLKRKSSGAIAGDCKSSGGPTKFSVGNQHRLTASVAIAGDVKSSGGSGRSSPSLSSTNTSIRNHKRRKNCGVKKNDTLKGESFESCLSLLGKHSM